MRLLAVGTAGSTDHSDLHYRESSYFQMYCATRGRSRQGVIGWKYNCWGWVFEGIQATERIALMQPRAMPTNHEFGSVWIHQISIQDVDQLGQLGAEDRTPQAALVGWAAEDSASLAAGRAGDSLQIAELCSVVSIRIVGRSSESVLQIWRKFKQCVHLELFVGSVASTWVFYTEGNRGFSCLGLLNRIWIFDKSSRGCDLLSVSRVECS